MTVMPIPRLMGSPALEPKNMLPKSLPHSVISIHVSQLTHARISAAEATRDNTIMCGKRREKPNFGKWNSFVILSPHELGLLESYFEGLFSFDESRICRHFNEMHVNCEEMILSNDVPLEIFGFRDIWA
jgi:hypothetical protein